MSEIKSSSMIDRRRGSRGQLDSTVRVALALLAAFAVACGDYGGGGSSGGSSGALTGGQGGGPGTGSQSGASVAEQQSAFSTTAYPLLNANCAGCHAGAGPGFPSIAHTNLPTAYSAVVDNQKVNLGNPVASRLVQRLTTDFHHCWTDCTSDGLAMQAAIAQWAALISFGQGGGGGGGGGGGMAVGSLASSALAFTDGIVDQGEQRYTGNVIALWEFKEGTGTTAMDTSGVAPAIDLSLQGVDWMSAYGISIVNGKAQAPSGTSRKLYDRIADPQNGTQQYSLEGWVVSDNVGQEGPARIISYSRGTGSRNFTLGQTLYNYDLRNRSMAAEVNSNGSPSLQTYDGDQDLQATLQHVVVTYDQYRGRRIYVNGRWTDDVDEQGPGRLWTWDDSHHVVMGNETTDNRLWVGRIRLAAIYDVALTEAQILQNFNAGVGRRVKMQFDLSQWIGAGSYIQFTVSEFDDYSYLFCEPTLFSPSAVGLRVARMRIAINGNIPVAGQAFINVDELVNGPSHRLSEQCSVVPKDLGPVSDAFHIEFEILGSFQNLVVENPPVPPPPSAAVLGPFPGEGLRDFARINDTMAAVTGVDPNSQNVNDTYQEIQQQLPSTFDVMTFTSSHQVGTSKLALEYCDSLIESPTLRQGFFGSGFDFDATADVAFSDPAVRDVVTGALIDRVIGVDIPSQPLHADVEVELDGLIDGLTTGCDPVSCPADRTRTVVKAACAAVLGSAATVLH
jgi:hypothetical protein